MRQGDALIFPATVRILGILQSSDSGHEGWQMEWWTIFRVESTYRGGIPLNLDGENKGTPGLELMIWGYLIFGNTHIYTHITHSFERLWCHQEIRDSFEGPATPCVHFLTNRWSCGIKKNETCTWRSKYMGFFQSLWLLAAEYTISLWSTIYFNCSAWTDFNSIKLPGFT